MLTTSSTTCLTLVTCVVLTWRVVITWRAVSTWRYEKVRDPVRFQVMAYDYDADKMTFRMGTPYEYGGVKRSKLSVVPFAVDPGKAVPDEPMKPVLKAPGSKRLKPKYDEPLSSFAFNFNLRRYTRGPARPCFR